MNAIGLDIHSYHLNSSNVPIHMVIIPMNTVYVLAEVSETVVETTKKKKEKNHKDIMNPLEAALAPYGPWGYLILGILLSGALLMFCGIWG